MAVNKKFQKIYKQSKKNEEKNDFLNFLLLRFVTLLIVQIMTFA